MLAQTCVCGRKMKRSVASVDCPVEQRKARQRKTSPLLGDPLSQLGVDLWRAILDILYGTSWPAFAHQICPVNHTWCKAFWGRRSGLAKYRFQLGVEHIPRLPKAMYDQVEKLTLGLVRRQKLRDRHLQAIQGKDMDLLQPFHQLKTLYLHSSLQIDSTDLPKLCPPSVTHLVLDDALVGIMGVQLDLFPMKNLTKFEMDSRYFCGIKTLPPHLKILKLWNMTSLTTLPQDWPSSLTSLTLKGAMKHASSLKKLSSHITHLELYGEFCPSLTIALGWPQL